MPTTTSTSTTAAPGRRSRRGRSLRRFGALLVASGTLLLSIPALGGTATAGSRPVPVANPDLAVGCGLDVSLVLDRSGSITDAGAQPTVTVAGQAFVDGLQGTGSQVKVVSFGADAAGDGGDEDLGRIVYRSPAVVTVDEVDVGRTTNWDDALEVVRRSSTPTGSDRPGGDLVVVVTDGRPTARNEMVGSGDVPGDGHEGATTQDGDSHSASDAEIDEAVREANWLKADGSHLFVVAVTDQVGLAAIRAITDGDASQAYTGVPGTFAMSDHTRVDTFADLATTMRRLATEACTLQVDKAADTDPATDGLQDDPVPAGAEVRYVVTIENTTPQPVTVESLRDTWGTEPGGEAVPMADLDCGGGSVPPFALPVSTTATCTFRAALPTDASGVVADHVEVGWRLASDDDADPPRTAGDDAAVTVAPPLAVVVTKSAEPTSLPAPGGEVTYTVLVENASVVPVTITELVDHEGPDVSGAPIGGFGLDRCDTRALAPADDVAGGGPDTATCRATLPTGERSAGDVVEDTAAVTVTEQGGERTAVGHDSTSVAIIDADATTDDETPPTTAPPTPEPTPPPERPEVVESAPRASGASADPSPPVAAATRLATTGSAATTLARIGLVLVASGVLVLVIGTQHRNLPGLVRARSAHAECR